MPPRTKRPREDDASASGTARDDAIASLPPWPKREGARIRVTRQWEDPPAKEVAKDECTLRGIAEAWDDYDTLFYNAWLKVEIAPTRFACEKTMSALGIKDDTLHLLERVGMGTMATRQYDLYPDLVRQFIATARVYYRNEIVRNALEGTLTFLIRGIRYRIPLPELCAIYGFPDEHATGVALQTQLPDTQDFWGHFGNGRYDSKTSTQTDIRHPTLRYLVRLFATTLLCKHEPGKMRVAELVLLYRGLWAMMYEDSDAPESANLGAVFAHHLASLKTKPFSGTKTKPETVGSLLTPIFLHCGIDLSSCTIDTSRALVDMEYLRRAHWVKPERLWVFTDEMRVQRMVQLPDRDMTHITGDVHRLAFQASPSKLRTAPVARPRGASRRAAEERARADPGPSSSRSRAPFPVGLPEAPAIPMEPDVFQRYVVQSFQAIWSAIATISTCSCARPPTPPRSPPQADEDE